MKKKKSKFPILVFAFIFLGLCLYILNAALWTNKNIKLESKPAASSQFNLKNLALNGTIDLNSEDVNSLIQLYLPKIRNQGSVDIEDISSTIKDNKLGFDISGSYHGINFLLSTNGRLEYDGTGIFYYPEYFKLGRLIVPKVIVLKSLGKFIPVNVDKERLEFDKGILPVEIKSLEIEEDVIHIVMLKSGLTPSVPKNTPKDTSKTSTKNSTGNTASTTTKNPKADLLKRASTQLKKVYGLAGTTKEKQIVSQIQNTLNSMSENINYSYKSDAAAVLSNYNKLNTTEKNNLKNIILNNMDFQTLLELKNTFGF